MTDELFYLKGHEECVSFLLDAGADITARDEHDYTVLHLAAFYGRVAVVALLLRLAPSSKRGYYAL